MRARVAVSLYVVVAAGACVRQPSSPPPTRGQSFEEERIATWIGEHDRAQKLAVRGSREALELSWDDTVRYRELTPKDFQAEKRPPGFSHANGAAIACGIAMRWQTISAAERPDHRFEASVVQLEFFGYMDRSRSWWNRGYPRSAATVRHEQTHFAICEVEARRANAAAADVENKTASVAATAEQAIEETRAKLKATMAAHDENIFKRQIAFDTDANVKRSRTKEAHWHTVLLAELEQTAAYETPHDTRQNIGADTDADRRGVPFSECSRNDECAAPAVCDVRAGYCAPICQQDAACAMLKTGLGPATCSKARGFCELSCSDGDVCPGDTLCVKASKTVWQCLAPYSLLTDEEHWASLPRGMGASEAVLEGTVVGGGRQLLGHADYGR